MLSDSLRKSINVGLTHPWRFQRIDARCKLTGKMFVVCGGFLIKFKLAVY